MKLRSIISSPNKPSFAGAAFLMATSAVGPGFITQTTVFTVDLLYDFGFVILVSVLLDIIVQLNIWRIIMGKQQPAPVIANQVVKHAGNLLSLMVILGGLIFNVGNLSGCGLALQALFGLDVVYGVLLSAGIAILIFSASYFGKVLDSFTRVLGIVMIVLVLWLAFTNMPPMGAVIVHSVVPEEIYWAPVLTLVGGTVGGYISFAGAHRLLEISKGNPVSVKQVNKQAITGIVLAGIVRVAFFLAILGIVITGFSPNAGNPTASIFQHALGTAGLRLFGFILWCASVTSVVGATYTSISFTDSFSSRLALYRRPFLLGFIALSTFIFLLFGQPVKVLVWAGAVNALVLPLGLGILLFSVNKGHHGSKYSKWLLILGWLVVLAVVLAAGQTFSGLFS